MKLALGNIVDDAEDVDELVHDYYARTIASEGMRPLKFRWPAYFALERNGACKLFTARESDGLIGFALYIVQEHLHHEGQIVAQCTMVGVRPEWRSKGLGRALVEFAEQWFKQHGVTHMVHHHRTLYDVTPLFEKLGFELKEVSYVKEL